MNSISIHQLHADLDRIAHRIAQLGTDAERDRLAEIARAIERFAPAVAEALVDPLTPEVSRLRAFAVACTTVRRLSARARSHRHLPRHGAGPRSVDATSPVTGRNDDAVASASADHRASGIKGAAMPKRTLGVIAAATAAPVARGHPS